MKTQVYRFELESMNNPREWVKQHPENLLFTYDGELECENIQVGNTYYRWCMGSNPMNNPRTFFVEEYSYKYEECVETSRNAYCPACGDKLDWEYEDGEIKCDCCKSIIEKQTRLDFDDIPQYRTTLVKLVKPRILEMEKISYEV